ncbi:MAG: hypothetical protein AAFW73_23330 [Bacteroidota bacterium]
MNNFQQITNSAEPRIIGTRNGVYQIEFKDQDLAQHSSHEKLDRLFIAPSKRLIADFNEEALGFALDDPLEGDLVSRAKVTDFMGFCPYFFCCNYVISEQVVTIFRAIGVNDSEINLLPVRLRQDAAPYFVLFVPMIPHEEILFEHSLIYPSNQALSDKRDYLAIDSYSAYKANFKKFTSMSFERIVLPREYGGRNLLSIQGVGNLFFSEQLFGACVEHKLTSFQVPRINIEVGFNGA